MRTLVTGGTGFTGSHLVRHLLGRGDQVRVLVRATSRKRALGLGPVEVVEGDIRDPTVVGRAVMGVDRVFHLAGLFRQARFPSSVYWDTNVEGVRNVLRAAAEQRVSRVVHCSTVGVLGAITHPPADEATPYNPGDIYQVTKMEGERVALAFAREEKLPLVVVRPAMIWGEGDRRMLKLFRAVARRRFLMIGDGRVFLHFVHVDDVCRGCLLAAENPAALAQIYIFAGAEPVELRDLVRRIARVNAVPRPRLRIPAMPVYILGAMVEGLCVPLRIEPPIYRRRVAFFTTNRWFSIEKAQTDLGYRPSLGLDQEIERISSWYRRRGWYD